jgi:hypothetical protein
MHRIVSGKKIDKEGVGIDLQVYQSVIVVFK